jgi:hypothetical protein
VPDREGTNVTAYKRNPAVEAAPMAGETVLYNPATNRFCVLNETATCIWDALEEPRTERELCERLLDQFDGVDLDVAERDVAATLSEFRELALALQA